MLAEQLQKTLSEYKSFLSRKQFLSSKGRAPIINIHIYFSEPYTTKDCRLVFHRIKKKETLQLNQTLNSSFSSSSVSTQHSRNYSSPTIIYQNPQNEKAIKENLLLSQIINQRKINAVKISSFLKSKLIIIKKKRERVINYIIQKRRMCIITIQKNLRRYFVWKHFRKILYSSKFVFFYSIDGNLKRKFFNGNGLKTLNMKILNIKTKEVYYTLEYSKYLDLYYLPIPIKGPIKKRLFVNFLFNQQCIIDPRYEVGCNEKGEYCNIIYHSSLYRTNSFSRFKTVEMTPRYKYWEKIFEMKNKTKRKKCGSSNSVSGISIDQYLGANAPTQIAEAEKIKPILKSKGQHKIKEKKVEFSNNIMFGY